MKKIFYSSIVILSLFIVASCSSEDTSSKRMSISGVIELPIPIESEKYWLTNGPLFVASKNPMTTYRVIGVEEIEVLETEKNIYDFFESSFENPQGIAEESFSGSHKEYSLKIIQKNGMKVFFLVKEGEAKAYIISKSMGFSVEIMVSGKKSKEIVLNIIDGASLTKGE